MDEFLVDSQNLIRFLVRRKALLLVGALCLLPTSWCRQQQILQHQSFFRRHLEIAILTLVARYVRLNARSRTPLIRIRPTVRH